MATQVFCDLLVLVVHDLGEWRGWPIVRVSVASEKVLGNIRLELCDDMRRLGHLLGK